MVKTIIVNRPKNPDLAAVVIGNGSSRRAYDIKLLKHVGTTYSCNAAHREFATDYLVAMDEGMVNEIIRARAYEDSVFYTQHTNASERLAESFSIYFTSPEPATLDSGNAAIRLAAQHGHNIVWIVGFDYQCPGVPFNVYSGTPNYLTESFYQDNEALVRGWKATLRATVSKYPLVQFYRVNAYNDDFTIALPNYHTISQTVFEQVIQGKQQ